jgi:hypothetical protein
MDDGEVWAVPPYDADWDKWASVRASTATATRTGTAGPGLW